MRFKPYIRKPESYARMERTFWIEVKNMISQGSKLSYDDIGEPYLKKFGYRVTKKHMSEKKSVFFNEDGIAFFKKV